MPPRILVTGSCTFFATRLIHELGRHGAIITAADSLSFSPGKSSRYVKRALRVPPISTNPGGYLDAILTELQTQHYDMLVPAFEETLLLAEYQSEIRKFTQIWLPDFATMYQLHHKPSLNDLCISLGLPTPPTRRVEHEGQLESIANELEFPLVLKLPAANNAVGRTYCNDMTELRREFNNLATTQREIGAELPFIQKKIDSHPIYTLCFCVQGRKICEVVYRTSRMYPQAGGVAAHKESIAHGPISRSTSQLVAATNWTGFLGLDFLQDKKSGISYLIDANPRVNPAIHLGFCAGVDWARMLIDLAESRVPETQATRVGVNVHNQLLDMAWLLEGLNLNLKDLMAFPRRFKEFLIPPWSVDSMDDLLAVREYLSATANGFNAIYAGIKGMMTGQSASQILFEHANYDAVTAEALRAQRAVALPIHKAA